jgi:hypothetical protein
MREDLQDLNPGKGMAQAMHAQADFDEWVQTKMQLAPRYGQYVGEWKEDRSFGRTLVLEATLDQISNITSLTLGTNHPMGITVDPTYPWRNFYGKVFLTPEVICAWLFACELTPPEALEEVRKLSLHK